MLTKLRPVLAPLVDHRVDLTGRVLETWWVAPPRGGRYRHMRVEVEELLSADGMSRDRFLHVRDSWIDLGKPPWHLECRLPRSLWHLLPVVEHGDTDRPMVTGKLPDDSPLRVQLRVQVTGISDRAVLGTRPRTPNLFADKNYVPPATWDTDPTLESEFRPPDAEERYHRGTTVPHRLTQEEIDELWRQFTEDQRKKENGQ